MPTFLTLKLALGALLLVGIGVFAMHFYNAGKVSQAIKDQPKVTQAVVGEIAAGVASGVSQGASQSNVTRLTKAQDTRKVSQEAQEVLTHVLQQQSPPRPTGTGEPLDLPKAALAGGGVLDIPDSVADSYLSGLQRVRDSGAAEPTAFHKCAGNAGTWLICS